jgi:D-glycero-alpha-D-manno-heptose-7-phosphate kinase
LDTDHGRQAESWRVPVRIDFAGGTLDLWPIYALMGGGCTVNAAIDLWIELEASFGGSGHRIESTDLGLSFEAMDWPQSAPRGLSWVWRVLSAAPRRPSFLNIRSPVPKGSGLGVSSCLGVGLLGMAMGIEAGEELAAQVPRLRDLEAQELQTPAGWQDYYPAALGGCLAMHWGPEPSWEPLAPHPELLEDLLVFYTGQPHHSGLTNWEAYKRFIEGDAATREALRDIALIADEMALALPSDPAAVGALLEREGAARVRLSPFVETKAMRSVRDRGKREGWFLGMKPCGAGGGGCCILVVKKGGRDAAQAALQTLALPILEADITQRGLHRI